MVEPDISELYSPVHKLSECFNKIEVQKHPTKSYHQLHIYWINGRYKVSSSFLKENGKQLAICVAVDITEFIYDEPPEFIKEKHEVINIPSGVESVVLEKWVRFGEQLKNGIEAGL